MTRLEKLNEMGKKCHFFVATRSLGDGVTRYKFFNGVSPRDYHEGYSMFTALSFKEAIAYAQERVDGAEMYVKALEMIASAERSDGAYDKHDMAGAIVIAKQALEGVFS